MALIAVFGALTCWFVIAEVTEIRRRRDLATRRSPVTRHEFLDHFSERGIDEGAAGLVFDFISDDWFSIPLMPDDDLTLHGFDASGIGDTIYWMLKKINVKTIPNWPEIRTVSDLVIFIDRVQKANGIPLIHRESA